MEQYRSFGFRIRQRSLSLLAMMDDCFIGQLMEFLSQLPRLIEPLSISCLHKQKEILSSALQEVSSGMLLAMAVSHFYERAHPQSRHCSAYPSAMRSLLDTRMAKYSGSTHKHEIKES